MDHFQDKIAIVTGGASGIGRALCQELGRRGATVVVADINAAGAGQVASTMTQARAAHLDVTQAGGVKDLVQETASEHGRLDYMFNNAGIAIMGEARDMELEHWRRILDVNLWGVVYGTQAAYPVMVRQGFGHIVNTASAAGLVPAPMATAYTATKHAVVGLSTALRAEAAALGVKVSVACPGLVQTGLVGTTTLVNLDREALISLLSSLRFAEPDDCARAILRGVARNKAIITDTISARLMWWFYRLHPALWICLARLAARACRSTREET
jgi:NAD(P)-dependent dehydrogenase (short-subunit alcohol dehydrogenase family)